MNRSSITAATRARNSSPAATRNPPSPWPTATTRSKASRCASGPRHRRAAARLHGDLQRLVRSRAGLRHRRQYRSTPPMRRPGVEWNHSVQDAAAMVRDYVKWDDYPASLQHFAESAVRAYKIAMTPPTLPVLLVADAELQEDPIPDGGASCRSPSCRRSASRGRFGRGRGNRADAGQCRKSGDHRRPLRPHRRTA